MFIYAPIYIPIYTRTDTYTHTHLYTYIQTLAYKYTYIAYNIMYMIYIYTLTTFLYRIIKVTLLPQMYIFITYLCLIKCYTAFNTISPICVLSLLLFTPCTHDSPTQQQNCSYRALTLKSFRFCNLMLLNYK